MAIFYCQMSPISRSSGRSSVAAAAYRAAEKLTNERDGLVHDYRNRQGVEHSEIVLPEGIEAEWAEDRSALWNAVEKREFRKDSRVAREFVLALPHELSEEARLELTRDFAQDLANRYGAAVDFAIHAPHPMGDVRNHHAHVMMTTRQVMAEGLGGKTYLELANKELLPLGLPTTQMQLVDIRRSWEHMVNRELAIAGLDIRIDHRSHAERGLEIEPTEHMGVRATNVQRRGGQVERARIDSEAARRNAELIRAKPEQVLTLLTHEKSVFDRHDVARILHRFISDDVQAFQNAFAAVMASPALVELQAQKRHGSQVSELARYTTRELFALEVALARTAVGLAETQTHRVDHHHVKQAIERQDMAIRRSVASDTGGKVERGEMDVGERQRQIQAARLSDEQRHAIEYITGPERISVVVGFAGAGKSTMLAAAREAWEAQGYKVHGAALSGKATEGLEESSGITSRTLASWDLRWHPPGGEAGRDRLRRNDVIVIDEAGMVGSRQLSRFVDEAEARGAKIVLVGDHEQLQAISAGAPFRAIAEQVGHADLSEIRRQRSDWQREASVAFATHRTKEGLANYHGHGAIRFSDGLEEARATLVHDYLTDRDQHPDDSCVAMAHRRADVRAINEAIRTILQERGALAKGEEGNSADGPAREISYQTKDGMRSFAAGDRIVFLQNDRDLGVKNGMLGTVSAVEPNAIHVKIDGKVLEPGMEVRSVSVLVNAYQSFDHGYATTIHKNQGATVDRAFVLASRTMNRHLTYVAMTRHRDNVSLYASRDEFTDRRAGRLIAHGKAPYEHKPNSRDSYYVMLENDRGGKHTIWGVDLERAMKDATPTPKIGARIGLEHAGSKTVRLPDGTTAERNIWKVRSAEELAYGQLSERLSRSGAKESVIDHVKDFAERRGVAEHFGVRSEIDLASAPQQARGSGSLSPDHERIGRQRSTEAGKRRRGMFDGLKLGPGAAARQSAERGEGGERSPVVEQRVGEERQSEGLRPPSDIERAVDRYARAFAAADRNLLAGLPMLETQKLELQHAGRELDHLRPGTAALMASALQHDPETLRAMTEFSGRQRAGRLIDGMEREHAALADPDIRADRFVQRWQELQQEGRERHGWQHEAARDKVEALMRGMAKSLEGDPQVELILRNRSRELGISHVRHEQSIAREIEQSLSRARGQERER